MLPIYNACTILNRMWQIWLPQQAYVTTCTYCCMLIHSAAADTDLQHIYNNPGHRSNRAPILRLLHQHGYSNNKFLSYSYLLCWCVSTHRESDLKGPRHTRLLRGAAHQPNIHYLPTVNICIPCQGCKCPKLTFAIKNFTDMYSIHV